MWGAREWIESHLDVDEMRNQVNQVGFFKQGGDSNILNHPCCLVLLNCFAEITEAFPLKKRLKKLTKSAFGDPPP